MSDKYGDAREELGRMLERKEILEEILGHIDVCRDLRKEWGKGTPQEGVYTTIIDAMLFLAKRVQARGVG